MLKNISRLQSLSSPYRTYSISRFPTRTTGSGRAQRKNTPHSRGHLQPIIPTEANASDEESQLWHTSQRPPTNPPENGLWKLLLENDTLIIERQLEMLNIFVGFEQSNKYSISNEAGEPLGFIAEEPKGFLAIMARQAFATHRPFRAVILDLQGTPILWVRRPFAWINSRMFVQRLKDFSEYTSEGEPVLDTFGEVQQIWHPWRRRYDLFLRQSTQRVLSLASEPQPEPLPDTYTQFAKVDSGFLAWDFRLHDARGEEIAFISRAFRGFGREIFTDTGRYCVQFGPSERGPDHPSKPSSQTVLRNLDLDERALCLALAVNIDFDYFSRHSRTGSGGFLHMSTWE
ncbi:Scramblase-domain-containing protein [Crucibulum laeve]|uniref:Phospholipid scramblase n=1 Tax=Crucibulum laeve TaxID=68775 RepID=A0A5C3ME73_9AGAR|nr:Scramblase-domain-containing protein [Crucibulum laeve]